MSGYAIANYVAWVLAILLFGWLIFNFIETERKFGDDVILASYDEDEYLETDSHGMEGGVKNE